MLIKGLYLCIDINPCIDIYYISLTKKYIFLQAFTYIKKDVSTTILQLRHSLGKKKQACYVENGNRNRR